MYKFVLRISVCKETHLIIIFMKSFRLFVSPTFHTHLMIVRRVEEETRETERGSDVPHHNMAIMIRPTHRRRSPHLLSPLLAFVGREVSALNLISRFKQLYLFYHYY